MTVPNEFEAMVHRMQNDPWYQERERSRALEAEKEKRLEHRRRLRAMAWRAVQALKNPSLAAKVEELIHEVSGGVEALASWEARLRTQRELEPSEVPAVRAALESTPLDWALRKVDSYLNEGERLSAPPRKTR